MFGKQLKLGLIMVLLLAAASAYADYDQAMNYFNTGKYMEAAAEFQALVDGSPNYDFGYFMLGYSFLQMNKPKDAETNLLKAIELNGDKYEYHQALAQAYSLAKDYPKTIATLRTAEDLATSPGFQFALYKLRGSAYMADEKWSEAIRDLEKAQKIKSSTEISQHLGNAYFNLAHMDKALPHLRDVLAAHPNDKSTLRKTTKALLDLGAEATSDRQKSSHYNEALQTAQRYQAQDANSAMASNYVGRAALGAKKFAEAETAFRRVLAIEADHCYAMTNLGKTYIALQRWADAESTLKDAGKCSPRSSVVFESLGFAQQKQKKLEECITSYERANQIKPSRALQTAIATARENLDIAQHNTQMDELEARQAAELEAEAARLEAERAKAAKWRREHEMDAAEGDEDEDDDEGGDE